MSNIEWCSFVTMNDVDEMEEFWTKEINKCLDQCAPWKQRQIKQKRCSLPKDIQEVIKKKKQLHKVHQINVLNGNVDLEVQKQLKKHMNYCNKLIKKAVRENNGTNITSKSSINEIWNCINDILKPENTGKNTIKIETENQLIEDPNELAEKFNLFFKEKIENLSAGIKKDVDVDPFSKLREKHLGSNLNFKLKTVSEKEVLKILKTMKQKRSYGVDGISSEVLKLGAEVLVVPLTYIINFSIVTGKYPTNWKLAKVIPLFKKGDKKLLKNYRPVSLLSVAGMVLERIFAIQVEEHFESDKLFGEFQFGFRKNKSTISELLTLFDSIMEAKEDKKEILVLLYDLSSAFDTVSSEILLSKLKIYGFDNHALKWMKSYMDGRKQQVTISGKMSSIQEMNTGTPQGSRLSPLLFICLMADMNLWIENSKLSNFADDTQSIVISDTVEEALEITAKEANNVISFFGCNNLVNNANKAAVLYNSKGTGRQITLENIGGENINSTDTEKLLGLHLNSGFGWKTHVDKISIDLKRRIGLLRRIRNRVPINKLVIIAEIFSTQE